MDCQKQPCKQRRSVPTLAAVVECYILHHRDNLSKELRYYAQQPSLSDAIEKASLCVLCSGKRHVHQRRIPKESLKEANNRLQQKAREMYSFCSFADLLQLVDKTINPIGGIGDLTVYDIAHRIGAKLGLAPRLLYLHAGTREGAGYLGLKSPNETLPVSSLPKTFHRLNPDEIEDCLCIFKNDIKKIIHL